MERRLKPRLPPEFRGSMHQTRLHALFSPQSFLLREKRLGRRRRVRNDRDGTSRRKRRLLSSVLVSSFPNRKLNLRFGFFYANLRQPLSLGCAEPAPLEGEPRVPHRRRYSELGNDLSVSLRLTAPLRGEPFPLRRGSIPQALRASSLYTRELLLYWKCSAKVSQWSRRWARLRLRAAAQAARVS